jgi:hypothetical protein
MNHKVGLYFCSAVLCGAFFVVPYAAAQQKPASGPQAGLAYDLSRETFVQGTVVSYTAASSVPPIGPHASIQTASGVVDVQLGRATVMKQNDVFLEPGDSVKIVGMSQSFGGSTIFLARILQKGSQTVTLRNLNGIPIMAKPAANAKPRSVSGGAR